MKESPSTRTAFIFQSMVGRILGCRSKPLELSLMLRDEICAGSSGWDCMSLPWYFINNTIFTHICSLYLLIKYIYRYYTNRYTYMITHIHVYMTSFFWLFLPLVEPPDILIPCPAQWDRPRGDVITLSTGELLSLLTRATIKPWLLTLG